MRGGFERTLVAMGGLYGNGDSLDLIEFGNFRGLLEFRGALRAAYPGHPVVFSLIGGVGVGMMCYSNEGLHL